MVQKIHPQGVIWVRPGLVTCQKKNDNLAVQYEDVHDLDSVRANRFYLSNCICRQQTKLRRNSEFPLLPP